MKATLACAALVAGASAGTLQHRHNHAGVHAKRDSPSNQSGETFVFPTSVAAAGTTTATSTSTSTVTVTEVVLPTPVPQTVSSTGALPTPVPQTISSTGVYTFPASTVTLNGDTTVPAPSQTSVPAGTHTLGGVTTVVSSPTTITCPFATVSTSAGVTTSVIDTTTMVCPSSGTYTIAPITTTVTEATTVTIPVVTTYPAGTYTQPSVVTTISETSTVIYCPFSTSMTSAATSPVAASTSMTSAATSPVAASTSTSAATSPVAASTSTSAATSPVAASTSTSAATSPVAASTSTAPAPGVPGKPWAISYTPYETSASGGCKTQDEVNHDIAAIAAAGISTVRVYSTDCNTLDTVGSACEANGIKMILGIFIDQPGCLANSPSVTDQISAIKSWSKWDLVSMISVGNEAVQSGFCTASELASLITSTQQQLSYTGPYTTSETVNIWQEANFISAVCPLVDVVGANAHAYFNTGTSADQAGDFVSGQLDIINSVCPGKEGRIMETGWPSDGLALGLAIPGISQQATAIQSIVGAVGDKAVLFSLTSDAWKSGSTECQCEQHWGCASVLGINL
ncbi:glycoside hydrolase family 17 protein [Xylaria sp. CBS 124048]|nr:glycoside hydrolase family 17 protein [Xylaria sp. CBS 124048]